VPFDFRHHTPKKRWEFPKEWALTPERKVYLAQKRAEAAKLEDRKVQNGQMIDGKTVIETSLPLLNEAAAAQEEPVMVGVGKQQLS
jgi:small subunit ribosomal protein S35